MNTETTTTTAAAGERLFWADGFDMDLYRLFPEAKGFLEFFDGIELRTRCAGPFNGGLNHPAVWNSMAGLTGFFGIKWDGIPSERFSYGQVEAVACTWGELVRDVWIHGIEMQFNRAKNEAGMHLSGRRIQWAFHKLMYQERGWGPGMGARELWQTRRAVKRWVRTATDEFFLEVQRVNGWADSSHFEWDYLPGGMRLASGRRIKFLEAGR